MKRVHIHLSPMETRIKLLLSLPIASIDRMRLKERMDDIDRTPGEENPK